MSTETTTPGGLGREELRERLTEVLLRTWYGAHGWDVDDDANEALSPANREIAGTVIDALLASDALDAVRGEVWDEGVDAAFRGAVTRQNAADVKRGNPYRAALGERGER